MNFKAIIYGGIASLRLAPFQERRFSAWLKILDACDFRTFATNVLLQVFSPDFVALHPDHYDTMLGAYCRYYEHRPEAVRSLILAMRDVFVRSERGRESYACPVHIVGAEADLLLPMNYIEEYGREIGAESIVMLPGGHATRIEQHARLAETIGDIAGRYS
jgi:pimeloyl-ACP methyl ester carboxylesterase